MPTQHNDSATASARSLHTDASKGAKGDVIVALHPALTSARSNLECCVVLNPASSHDHPARPVDKEKERLRQKSRQRVECLDFHASNKLVNSVLAYRDLEWIRLPVYLLVKGDVVSLSSADEERLPRKILRQLEVDAVLPSTPGSCTQSLSCC